MRTRDFRRAQMERKKAAVRRWPNYEWREYLTDRLLGIKTHTPQTCNKMCCSHFRYWSGPRVGEIRRINAAESTT